MIELRNYQQRDVNAVLASLQRGESPVRQLPTGGGKTVEAAHVVSSTVCMGWEWGIFVHRVELLHQMSGALRRMGVDHGIIAPGHELTSHKVHVASIDTVGARIDSMRPWLRRVRGLPDECHHAVASSWDRILQITVQRVGYTATPCRLDGRGLGETGLFNKLIKGPSIAALTQMGFLAPAEVFAPPTGIDFSKVKKARGDYVLSQIAALTDTDEMALLARKWYAMICPGQPAIVFCTTVEHAENVAAAFGAAGWRSTSVDGTMSPKTRAAAIGGLADGSVQVLTSCSLVGEGLDIPAVSAAIMLRKTASTSLFLQQQGRCLRPHEDKTSATIIDLVGNTGAHGRYDAERQWDLRSGLKGLERAVAGTWRCRKCYRIYAKPDESIVMKCGCGASQKTTGMAPAKFDNMPSINGVSADLLFRMKLVDAVKHCKTLPDYEALAKIKDYKPGWAYHAWQYAEDMRKRFSKRRVGA
jgi:superfamily II DNA or RNA helicase